MISQRDAFFSALFDLARKDRSVILMTADCGAPALDHWRVELPDQYINVGIAEQNGLLVSAGLALEGKRPYFYAIAPFATLRCLEQIRVNLSIMRLPIVIVGIGAGLSYEDSGPTHHVLEDMAVMRALPGLTIWSVTDSVMAGRIAQMTYLEHKPAYIRLDREAREPLYGRDADEYWAGMSLLYAGHYDKNIAILSTGNMVYEAFSVAKGYGVACIDVYRFPINGERLTKLVGGFDALITMEEHYLSGGFGSAIAESLSDQGLKIPLRRVGIRGGEPYSYVYGGRDAIREDYGIGSGTIEDILSIEFLIRKGGPGVSTIGKI